ncbi:hypothetical protein ACFQZ4_20090 [Catellatospora coxensis]
MRSSARRRGGHWTQPRRRPCSAPRGGVRRAAGAGFGVRDAGLRDAGRPGVITYSKKVFIPLTRLCRDRCHYCTFATVPHRLPAAYLDRDEVLAIARQGAALGCKEALFTLGDRPEERWPAAQQWLTERGTPPRSTTCVRWRSRCWRRPGCCRI